MHAPKAKGFHEGLQGLARSSGKGVAMKGFESDPSGNEKVGTKSEIGESSS
jgi:hypothetical protein